MAAVRRTKITPTQMRASRRSRSSGRRRSSDIRKRHRPDPLKRIGPYGQPTTMASTMAWPAFSTTDSPLDALVKLSRFYGANPEFVLAGGGNTSVKVGDRLFVKGSGHALATIGADGFVELDRKKLEALLKSRLSDDRMKREEEFRTALMASRLA